MTNKRIREELKRTKIKQWQLADYLGIREETLSRMLRYELRADKAGELLLAIERLVKERDAE